MSFIAAAGRVLGGLAQGLGSIIGMVTNIGYAAQAAGNEVVAVKMANMAKDLSTLRRQIDGKVIGYNQAIGRINDIVSNLSNVKMSIDPRLIGKLEDRIADLNSQSRQYTKRIDNLNSAYDKEAGKLNQVGSGITGSINVLSGKVPNIKNFETLISENNLKGDNNK